MLPVLAALALLCGCSANFIADRQGPSAETPKRVETTRPPAVQREHERILAAYGGAYEDPAIEALTAQTVERLVAASPRPDLHYKVTILNSPAINAFALPSGQLYVTRGLLALANDRAELASVLAHEMAHVIAHHADIREEQARRAIIVNQVATDLLADPQLGALALAKSKIAIATFSRAQEYEADKIGVGIAARAGFDPYGASRFLNAMERNATLKNGSIDLHSIDFLSSHPNTPDRVQAALTTARHFSGPGSGERDRISYISKLDGVVYGEDPSEGFVRGRHFLHPRLGFTFTAPEGFSLENTAQAVFGVKDGGGEALRLDVVRIPVQQSLTDYMKSGWVENVDPASVQDTTVNGLKAATATAIGDQWSFRLYAVRVDRDFYRFVFAYKDRTQQIDQTARDTVSSFRRMTIAEIKAAKPLRLKIITFRRGDSVERLASRMPVPDHAIERFRVLNGLDARQSPKPGDRIKVVAD